MKILQIKISNQSVTTTA